jgi:hypothetical protein
MSIARKGEIVTTLRFPPPLHKQVKDLAERERRSFHTQALLLIERQLDVEAPKKKASRNG